MSSGGERTPEVSFMQSTVKSVIKALSGRTLAPRLEDPVGPPSGEHNAVENWAHFADEVLRSDAAIEESPTGLQEILLPSGTGIVKSPLFKDLVGERIGQLQLIIFVWFCSSSRNYFLFRQGVLSLESLAPLGFACLRKRCVHFLLGEIYCFVRVFG